MADKKPVSKHTESNREDGAAKRSLRQGAYQRLAQAHRAEFADLMTEMYASAGFTYEPELTEEEKAQRTIDELVAKYPSLAGRVRATYPTEDTEAVAPLAVVADEADTNVNLGMDPALSRAKKRN